MKKKTALGALALSVMLLTGCNGNNGVSNKVIIKVNGESITEGQYKSEFDKTIQIISANQQNFNINDPKNKFFTIIYKDKVVNDLTMDKLLTQEATKHHVDLSNEDIKKAVTEMEKRFGGPEGLNKMLKANNVSRARFESDIRHQVLIDKTVDATKMIKNVSDAEVKKYYEKNRESLFKYPDLVRASHILLKEDKALVNNISAQLKKNPADFPKLAMKYSADTQSATKGGDLGYFQPSQMVPEFAKAVTTLTPGKISNPVKSQYGYHIILVIDKKKGGYISFNDVKGRVKEYLTQNQKMDVYKKIMTNARAKAKIQYVDQAYNPVNIRKEILKIAPPSELGAPGAMPPPQPATRPE